MTKTAIRILYGGTALALVLSLTGTPSAEAQTYSIIHRFAPTTGDGAHPHAGLIADAGGNLYGTTSYGGAFGFGVVFKLDSTGKETVLYSFAGGAADGSDPSDLLRDSAGNFYGSTGYGGIYRLGVLFKLDATGKETVFHSFAGPADGFHASGRLIGDLAGNLYGTTSEGGAFGNGTMFKVDATGKFTLLHSFASLPADGNGPASGVSRDSAGNLYGTTQWGGTFPGTYGHGLGVFFKLDTAGNETILHNFAGAPTDGAIPVGKLIRDGAGNFYGTTSYGGTSDLGTIFKLDSTGKETVLHSFTGGPSDGERPYGGVIGDLAGNLYGTTIEGGASGNGVIFKLDSTGKLTVLHSFAGLPADGAMPFGGLIRDPAGNLYGMTFVGGPSNSGVIFKLQP